VHVTLAACGCPLPYRKTGLSVLVETGQIGFYSHPKRSEDESSESFDGTRCTIQSTAVSTPTDCAPFLKDSKHATLMCHSLGLQNNDSPSHLRGDRKSYCEND
jgi:hypothetical protein